MTVDTIDPVSNKQETITQSSTVRQGAIDPVAAGVCEPVYSPCELWLDTSAASSFGWREQLVGLATVEARPEPVPHRNPKRYDQDGGNKVK